MFLWSINIFNNSSFNTFPGISQNLPENVSIFFAKMIDLCLLTQKMKHYRGVIGRNIALWQNLWVGVGLFERRSSSARAPLALCSRFNQFRSPYSWITMRRALRKRRVFDFVPVPSYLKLGTKSKTRRLRSILCIVKSRKWRPELIESAAEHKRHTRWRSLMTGLPIANFAAVQCNISSKYPLPCVVFLSQQTYMYHFR